MHFFLIRLTCDCTKDFFLFDYNLFYKPIFGLIFTENRFCFTYNSEKNSNLNFFQNLSFKLELYLSTNRKYFTFRFQTKLSRVILATTRILFSKGSPKTSSQRLNLQYFLIKILWNFVEMIFFHMPKVRIK